MHFAIYNLRVLWCLIFKNTGLKKVTTFFQGLEIAAPDLWKEKNAFIVFFICRNEDNRWPPNTFVLCLIKYMREVEIFFFHTPNVSLFLAFWHCTYVEDKIILAPNFGTLTACLFACQHAHAAVLFRRGGSKKRYRKTLTKRSGRKRVHIWNMVAGNKHLKIIIRS